MFSKERSAEIADPAALVSEFSPRRGNFLSPRSLPSSAVDFCCNPYWTTLHVIVAERMHTHDAVTFNSPSATIRLVRRPLARS